LISGVLPMEATIPSLICMSRPAASTRVRNLVDGDPDDKRAVAGEILI
jgi:hypothetical protein